MYVWECGADKNPVCKFPMRVWVLGMTYVTTVDKYRCRGGIRAVYKCTSHNHIMYTLKRRKKKKKNGKNE